MEKNRLSHIDLLKSFAIFFVVAYHSTIYPYNFLEVNRKLYYLIYFIRTIFSTCVPLFFFVNGYLLFSKDFNLRKHVFKMIKLVLITVIWGIITIFCLQVIRQEYFPLAEVFNMIWRLQQRWVNHLWYMGALICIYVFFPILKNVYDTNMKLFYYFTSVAALLTFGNTMLNHLNTIKLNLTLPEPVSLTNINYFNMFNPFRGWYGYAIVYFCVGGIVYHLKDKIGDMSVKKRNFISVFGIVLSCMGLCGIGIFYTKRMGYLWDVVWCGYDTIFTFLNVIFIYILCLNWKWDNRFIRTLSSNSLGIYFTHWIIIEFINPYLTKYEFFKTLPCNFIVVCCILIVCLIICSILRKIPVISKLVR